MSPHEFRHSRLWRLLVHDSREFHPNESLRCPETLLTKFKQNSTAHEAITFRSRQDTFALSPSASCLNIIYTGGLGRRGPAHGVHSGSSGSSCFLPRVRRRILPGTRRGQFSA